MTGVLYRDDPTIFAWELMNESTVTTPEGMAARRAWIAEMAGLLRARDPNHLISPGLLGYDTIAERQEWVRVMQLPLVDYCDAHLYPQDNYYKLRGRTQIERAVDDVAQLARFVVKKPLIFGEFGFRAHPPTWEGQHRAGWFDVFLRRVFDDGAAGALVWIYEPWFGRERRHGIYVDHERGAAVRAVLRRQAERLVQPLPELRNPALGPARGSAMLLDQFVTVQDPKNLRSAWRPDDDGSLVLDFLPGEFSGARWERVGVWDGGTLVHAYGAESGYFEYRFELPPQPGAQGAAHPCAPLLGVPRCLVLPPRAARSCRCWWTAPASPRYGPSPTTASAAGSRSR